jgi:hypothetical protein
VKIYCYLIDEHRGVIKSPSAGQAYFAVRKALGNPVFYSARRLSIKPLVLVGGDCAMTAIAHSSPNPLSHLN